MSLTDKGRRFLWMSSSILVLCLCLTACQLAQPKIVVHSVPIQRIQVPDGDYIGFAWLTNDQIVVRYDPDPKARNAGSNLWIMQDDGSNLHILNLPQDKQHTCDATFFRNPVSLSDGRLAFERSCATTKEFHANLLDWDPGSNTSESMYDYDLPINDIVFAIAPDLSRGVFSPNTGIQDSLFWLSRQSVTQINLGFARANNPTWSPNGQSIAFWGNQQMPGSPGPTWANQPTDLWVMKANCEGNTTNCTKDLKLLLSDIYDPTKIEWSPDGHWLVFDGNLMNHGQGIWLLKADASEVVQVATGDYIQPEWSPDGKSVIVNGPAVPLGQDKYPIYRPLLYVLSVNGIVNADAAKTTPP